MLNPIHTIRLSDKERINFNVDTKHSKTYVVITYQVAGKVYWETQTFPETIKIYDKQHRLVAFASEPVENSEDDFFRFVASEDEVYQIYRDDNPKKIIFRVVVPKPYIVAVPQLF